jgi:hypothetical protein
MTEIRYKANFEVADITGRSIADAREQFKTEFGIADKAAAFLNGKKVNRAAETAATLGDKDTLVFKASGINNLFYLVGAMILAMAISGGVFAYGFLNDTATINATISNSDFASVTANTSSSPLWNPNGMQRTATGTGTLFDIDTATSGYAGDFLATISLSNSNDLIKVYRNLALYLEVRDSSNNLVDINEDGIADSADYTLLTLENNSVTLSIAQVAADVYTVFLKGGYYSCNAYTASWTDDDATPMLYCELAQK